MARPSKRRFRSLFPATRFEPVPNAFDFDRQSVAVLPQCPIEFFTDGNAAKGKKFRGGKKIW
jgi:hypothetical protein